MPARAQRARVLWLPAVVIVAGCAFSAPPEPTPPEITRRPTPLPTPRSTGLGQASPTPAITAIPEPTPNPAVLDLEAISCHGGVVLDWSPASHPDFHHYTALRSPERDIAPNYPPVAPAVDWGDTYTTDRFVTSGVDASIVPSKTRWNYRVIAYDTGNAVLAASSVRAARLREPRSLGPLEVVAGADGVTRLSWRAYAGRPRCFSAYRILAGSDTLTIVSDQSTDTFETDALQSGTTYELEVRAVRTTTLGSFVLGDTGTVTFTAP